MSISRIPLLALSSVACLALAQPSRAAAPGFADLAAVDSAVSAFTGTPIGQSGGAMLPVDRRLKLSPCDDELTLSWRTAGHQTVVVNCPDPGGWHLFVPVKAAASETGPAAAPAVVRGDALTIAASGDGFSVSQPGEALEGGPVGSWIRVRAGEKGEVLRAQIVRPGLVLLPVD
ncbi:flagella basal body P-ring formation protein FlgA [Novosphingobium lentum]|uniref:flagella basal body P-ring formation protein FlgA n=1 Tax=Novosphingobium lentum TaxID=145287 RepID=UPI000A740043|nr:flagella basal body P-ring formation protein FlgA [Novosphingobium lentum]